MTTYILVGILIVFVGMFSYQENRTKSGLGFIFVVLTLLMGLRGEMSEDHPEYNEFFLRVQSIEFGDVLTGEFTMENGFAVFCKLISYITSSPVLFMLIVAVIIVGLYSICYNKSAKIPWLAMVMFFAIGDYFDSFNIVRNILAASICFFAITYFASGKKKNFIVYLALVLLASTIHAASIFMIPMYFVIKIKYTKKTLFAYSIIGVLLFVFLPRLIELFMRWFPKYAKYENADITVSNINAVIPTLGVFLFVIACVFMFKVDLDLENDENRVALHGLTLTLIFIIASTQAGLSYRFAHFFKPFVAIAAVNTVSSFKDRKNKELFIWLVSFVAIVAVWVFYRESPYNPYYLHSDIMELLR